MTEKTYKVGVIGHRDLGSPECHSFVHFCCHRFLAALKKKHKTITAVSAISEGADSVFAQSALSLGVELESVIPFDDFSADFQEDISFARYNLLRSNSASETKVSFSARSNEAYKKSMEWVVVKSDILFAIWDGKEAGSIGGTWEAVCLCKKMRKPMVHINCNDTKISFYYNGGCSYDARHKLTVDEIARLLL